MILEILGIKAGLHLLDSSLEWVANMMETRDAKFVQAPVPVMVEGLFQEKELEQLDESMSRGELPDPKILGAAKARLDWGRRNDLTGRVFCRTCGLPKKGSNCGHHPRTDREGADEAKK